MVFGEVYDFRFGIMGVAFLSIAVGVIVGFLAWVGYFYFYADKKFAEIMATGAMPPPEARLVPGLIFTWFIPAGLLLYGELNIFASCIKPPTTNLPSQHGHLANLYTGWYPLLVSSSQSLESSSSLSAC